MKKKRILWISDSPGLPTGNGKITRNFVNLLTKKGLYDIAVLGRGYIGWPGEQKQYGCVLYPMDMGRPYPELMKEISREFKPQVVISCLDMWQIDWIEHAKQSLAVTNIGYISIYGKPVPYSWKKVVKNLDHAICYSEFGRSVLKEFMPFSAIDMIHLGVDPEVYRPLNNREELKKKYNMEGKFVVGCIARNQVRKRLDKLIEGFSKFAMKCPSAFLYIKTETESDHGYKIPDLLDYYGVRDKTIIDEHKEYGGYSEEKIVELNNIFDVYVQTAGAEGFGFPILEAMSCGVPVIAPEYSAVTELVQGRGILLQPRHFRIVDGASVEQVSIDTDELAERLNELYQDKKQHEKFSINGREFASGMSWDKFGTRWTEILSHVAWEAK